MKRWSSFLSFLFLIFFLYISPSLSYFFIIIFDLRCFDFFTSTSFFYIYIPRAFLISYMIVSVIVCVCERVYLCFVCYFSEINAYCCSALFLFYFLFFSFSFFTSYFFLFSVSFGQGTAKTIKVGRVVAVLAMAFLISPFYLVIYPRVLCSSLGGYMHG